MKNKWIIFIFILCLGLLTGCTRPSNQNIAFDESKITVYTSFYPMYDFAKKVGGDKINLINLVPSGSEPHDWEPTPGDIANLENADVFIYSGGGMEGWADKILGSIGNKNLIAIEASKEIRLKNGDALQNDETKRPLDPHVWLNPLLAKEQMKAIKEGLILADPQNKAYYEENYLNNAALLDQLDAEFKTTLLPFANKDIIVAHEAYGYLCEAYHLNQLPIEGLNAEAEPSPSKMAEIVEYAREHQIKYIFFEELVSPKIAETIAQEIGAETAVLNPLEGLTDEDIQSGKEYFAVMRENLKALVKALI